MLTVWTEHLKTEEAKENFRGSVKGSRQVLDRLSEILDKEEQIITNTETTPKTYDCHNWPALQADMNGYRRCLKKVQRIINLDDQSIQSAGQR